MASSSAAVGRLGGGWQVTRDYTRGPARTWTRSSRAPTPPGAAAKAASSSAARSRSSWATIGASASTSSVNPSSRTTRQAPAAAGHALGDERLQRRDRPRQAELVLEAQRPGRVRDQVAEPDHRPAPRRAHGRDAVAAPGRRGGADELGAAGPAATSQAVAMRPQRRIEVVEGRGRHEGLGQGGDPADEVRAALRIELGEDVVEEEQRRPAVERRSGGRARPA